MQDLNTRGKGPAAGAVVAARGRHWRVVDAQACGECTQVRLAPFSGTGPAATLLHPFDRIDTLALSSRPRRASRRRTAEAAAAALLDSHPWSGLRAALAADIRLLAYQLDPALTIFDGRTNRVLLADEVGLGKTIQAGLIAAELHARHELTRALVVTPAGLRDQWERELADRFGLVTRRLDAATLAGAGRSLPPWVDLWGLPGIGIISIDLLKRGEILAQLRQTIWDLVIVDEAHHAAAGSDRGEAAGLVCSRARHVVLISATPHNGDRTAFAHLLDLGRLSPDEPPARVFRRTRDAASEGTRGRRTRDVRVRLSAAEGAVFAALDRYTTRVWHESADRSARLAMIVLRKRALSGAASLARSAARRLAALAELAAGAVSDAAGEPTQLALRFEDTLDGELMTEDAEPISGLGTPGLANATDERRLLADVLALAREAARQESKLALLTAALRRTREPVIVFTEYRDTLQEIARALNPSAIAQLHGGLMPAERRAAVDAFTAGRARVLLATDAAAEGLNLHHRCRWVVHYELPWNPARLEQRTGRVDRLGQSKRVHAWRLVAAETDEPRILAHLEQRADSSEEEVARSVFEGVAEDRPWRSTARDGAGVSAGALREAARLDQLRRLRRFEPRPSIRPLVGRARARGPFGALHRPARIAVTRGHALDGGGRRIAEGCRATVTPQPMGAPAARDRQPRAAHGVELRREIAQHRAWIRQGLRRDEALAAAVSSANGSGLQPSLFDRRAERERDRRRARVSQALDELDQHRRRLLAAAGRRTVATSLVVEFEVR